MVHWLRPCAFNTGVLGFRFLVRELDPTCPKSWCKKINIKKKNLQQRFPLQCRHPKHIQVNSSENALSLINQCLFIPPHTPLSHPFRYKPLSFLTSNDCSFNTLKTMTDTNDNKRSKKVANVYGAHLTGHPPCSRRWWEALTPAPVRPEEARALTGSVPRLLAHSKRHKGVHQSSPASPVLCLFTRVAFPPCLSHNYLSL